MQFEKTRYQLTATYTLPTAADTDTENWHRAFGMRTVLCNTMWIRLCCDVAWCEYACGVMHTQRWVVR